MEAEAEVRCRGRGRGLGSFGSHLGVIWGHLGSSGVIWGHLDRRMIDFCSYLQRLSKSCQNLHGIHREFEKSSADPSIFTGANLKSGDYRREGRRCER